MSKIANAGGGVAAAPSSKTGKSSGGSKGGKDVVQRPCQAHSFHTDAAEVQRMERELHTLFDDFENGKLRAFGNYAFFRLAV